MNDRRAYRITGRVQGVGFRWWTRRTAETLRLSGTVRNAADGSVEILVSGNPVDLDRFERRLREGPRGARVDEIRRREPGEEPLPAGFRIIH